MSTEIISTICFKVLCLIVGMICFWELCDTVKESFRWKYEGHEERDERYVHEKEMKGKK